MKYPTFKDNEWIAPVRTGFTMICCDCGLTHKADFRIKENKIQFRVKRNNHSTANVRKQCRRR